jgi:tetratricopeptide (TPR) repeat protein
MGQIENGLDFCRKKLDEQKKRLGKNHRCVADTLVMMGATLLRNDSNKSLQYLEEALPILENCRPPDHQLTVQCLNLIMSINAAAYMLEDAVKYRLRMLDIRYATLSSNHLDIAYSLYMLGWFYEHMRNTSEARRYYNQNFSIYQANSSSAHKDVKEFEARIRELKKLK